MKRYIDADITKATLKEYCVDDDTEVKKWYDIMGIDDCIDNNVPTADVRENVPGKWWHEPHTNNTWVQRCSNCFHVAMITTEEECPYNYCPICGADMRGGQHEKDN